MEIIFAVVVGFFLGNLNLKKVQKALHNKFRTPGKDSIELNWGGRELFGMISKKAGNRWYEAREHLNQGVFVSLFCTFKLIWIVRVDLIDDSSEYGRSKTKIFHGFQSLQSVMEASNAFVKEFENNYNKENPDKKMHYYQTFVAGYNVVQDYMNGSLV